ncbi:eukaryotic translation initiation factor 5B-like [Nylanderia fulva]|uniref:eukaryotic translation initiation factor 5B-like n=1 Tax=Nylanderia fulva TaxID=613905 RepID=UPI0010FB654C|nr:eukaryotic translation initiation factor 5B-like [Nylanderia fulva]
MKCDNSDADSKDDKQEERPGPSRQMASGSTRDNIFISTPHPKNIQRLSREYPENIQSSSASSLNVFGIRALLRTPDESVGSSRQMASGSTGDNMQGESVGPSRQMDSDPTEQPDNVSKESSKKKKQEYDLLSRKRMKCEFLKKKEQKLKRKKRKLEDSDADSKDDKQEERPGPSRQMASGSTRDNIFISTPHPKNIQRLSREYPENIQSSSASSLNVFGIRALLRTPDESVGSSRQMASGSTGDNMQGESVGPSRQMDSDPTEQPDNVSKESSKKKKQEYDLLSRKRMKCEFLKKRNRNDKQEERPGPSRQMASGSTRDNIFISTPHPKNIQRLSREYPENIQSSSASSLNVFGIRALLRTPDESVGSSRQMASGSTGDNMQGESVGPSRQMDSDPTEQPDNVSKESSKKKKQEYDLLSRKRMKCEFLKKKEQKLKRKKRKLEDSDADSKGLS